MSSVIENMNVRIYASRGFSVLLHKADKFDVESVSTTDDMQMHLVLGEIVLIVTLVKSLIDIIEFIIKYYKQEKKSERIIIVLENGDQIVISDVAEAERILVKIKDTKQ